MKKKIILKVTQPGIMFKLNKQKFRSPVSVDITYMKIDHIVSQMRLLGVKDYEIMTVGLENIKDPIKKNKVIILEGKSNDIDRLNSRINRLENILHELIDQSHKDKKEIDREQNIKDIRSDDKIIKSEKIKIKTIKPEIIIKESSVPSHIDNKKSDNINENILIENKKIEIEELELVEYEDVSEENDIPEKDAFIFKLKPFKYKSVVDPFEISPDIANLIKYKKTGDNI